MPFCKAPCQSGKRRASLHIAMRVCKSPRKSGKSRANLQIAMQLWKTLCKFTMLRQKNRRLEDLANIETPGRRECGKGRNAGVGLPLHLKKFHHDRFGVHADELLSKEGAEGNGWLRDGSIPLLSKEGWL